MTLKFAKRVAAEMLGRGENSIRINPASLEGSSKAMTREDVKRLIKEGSIFALKPKHNISLNSRLLRIKRRKGRSRGIGRRRGTRKTREGRRWEKRVRSQRMLLQRLREMGKVDKRSFRRFYGLVKGNSFPDKASLLLHLSEQGIKIEDAELKRINEYMKERYR